MNGLRGVLVTPVLAALAACVWLAAGAVPAPAAGASRSASTFTMRRRPAFVAASCCAGSW